MRRDVAVLVAMSMVLSGRMEAQGRWAGKIDTLPNGAVRVSNPAVGLWTSATAWRLEEDLRIGSVDGAGPDVFGFVGDIEVDAAGRIYALDVQANEIRVFEAGGRHVRTIGRKGQGPGEFEGPIALDRDPQGRIWVVDQRTSRFSVFDTNGVFVQSHRRPVTGLFVPGWQGGIDTRGQVFDVSMAGDRQSRYHVLLRLDAAMAVRDTIRVPSFQSETYHLQVGGMSSSMGVPFSPYLQWGFDTRGFIWFTTGKPYRLYQQNLTGDTVRVVEKPYQPLPVSGDDRKKAVEGPVWDRFRTQGGKIDESRVPSEKLAIATFFLGDDGSLWVRPVARDTMQHVYDVFTPEGRFLGEVRSPVKLRLAVFRRGAVYGMIRDEYDVNYVVRLRIVKPTID